MSLCESINLSTKPYFVGQKAFSIAADDREVCICVCLWGGWGAPRFSIELEMEASNQTDKRKLLPLPWKAKEGVKKMFFWQRNNQGYFFYRIPLLPCIIKIDCACNFQGRGTKKEAGAEGPIVVPARIQHSDIVAVKWQFC